MRKKSIRFNSKRSAESFADKVNGTVYDNRKQENYKSNFSVKWVSDKAKAPKRDAYGDWFEEASKDGSLAYNGVTEDF